MPSSPAAPRACKQKPLCFRGGEKKGTSSQQKVLLPRRSVHACCSLTEMEDNNPGETALLTCVTHFMEKLDILSARSSTNKRLLTKNRMNHPYILR